MNRRQKIIVSVTGIFLVLLLLVGLTYAYFLTKINGNENTKSISVSTANLALVYGDGNGIISAEKIQPGTTLDTKTFTVKNEGNATTDYVVVIEDVNVTYASTVEVDGVTHTAGSTTTFESNDFIYTLTCTEGCNGVNTETTFPMHGGILVGNSIEVGVTHTYELTVTYKETGVDQSNDMNKSLIAKVNIKDINSINPYSNNTDSLAYNIINNSIINKNGTELVATPKTKVAEERIEYTAGIKEEIISTSTFDNGPGVYALQIGDTPEEAKNNAQSPTSYAEAVGHYIYINYGSLYGKTGFLKSYNETTKELTLVLDVIESEKTLNVTADDYGTSYYYRGAVEDNYVNFAGMCWRIVRIDGEGNTKLVLEDKNAECDDNETTETSAVYTGDWVYGSGTFGYNFISAEDSSTDYGIYILNYLEPELTTDGAAANPMAKSFYEFQTTKLSGYLDKLKAGNWCYNDIAYNDEIGTNIINKRTYYNGTLFENFYYDSYVRLKGQAEKNPTLKCNGTNMTKFKKVTGVSEETDMYVGTLTADEIIFSGTPTNNDLCTFDNMCNTYLLQETEGFLTLSPGGFSYNQRYTAYGSVIRVGTGGITTQQQDNSAGNSASYRPAINLKSSVEIVSGGLGTVDNPYEIKID